MKELNWWGAYSDSLKGKIVDEAFSHPAKMAWGLTMRIFQHLFEEGWLKEGDLVADPFGGIATTGLAAASFGCPCILVELEEKFCKLAEDNFELHREQWEKMGKPPPIILQGDSRQFSSIIREAVDSVITSPPYADLAKRERTKEPWALEHGKDEYGDRDPSAHIDGYGQSEGQLGGMKEGDHAEVVDSIITSPPYAESLQPETEEQTRRKQERIAKAKTIHNGRALEKPSPGKAALGGGYGISEGQIGQEQAKTYWHSVMQVYKSCYTALRSGGVMAVVVKSFIRKGKIIDLPSQTLELLEAIGFEPLERIRAWMTSLATQKSLMPDIRPDYTKKKASFFRRLYERKYPENKIDFEEVLIARKPISDCH